MKNQISRKAIRAGVLTLTLAAAPFAATTFAQTSANSNYSATTAQTSRVAERDDDGTDFGWLGLLGLAGLAGLLKKPRQVVVDRTADTTQRARA